MNQNVTSRTISPPATVLARLAERWRPVGLYLASLDRDGALLWHDPQMPRVLTMCLTLESVLPNQIKRMGEAVTPEGVRLHAQLPWIQLQLVPTLKRRKVTGWMVVIGRTDKVMATREELARFAQRASTDAQALATLSQKAPQVPMTMFSALVRIIEQMHEDMHAST